MGLGSIVSDESLVLGAIDARTSLESIATSRDGIIARDLLRYYALVEFDLHGLEAKFSAAERMAIISTLQSAITHGAKDAWLLTPRVLDACKHERLTEQFDLDEQGLVAKVSALTRTEMTAFSDAAARWWQATGDGETPEQGDLFVGIRRTR